ncbi:MAG: nucleoside deaminase [Acidocella sp.]|nr:nucleoside deaminase [Acidocella sp.]
MSIHDDFMRRAIALAHQGMAGGHGGPFGAVIVREGKIVGEGHNRVLSACDPTAHAEVTAIRDAAAKEQKFELSGTTIYVNGMPCPMCMAAIFWARIDRVYYACSPEDAEAIGFDDDEFYRQLAKPPGERSVPAIQMPEFVEEARGAYAAWAALPAKVPY